jgi:hypothetical protein
VEPAIEPTVEPVAESLEAAEPIDSRPEGEEHI